MTDLAAAARLPRDAQATSSDADPAAAARLGLVAAGVGFRSLAFAIDAAIWLVAASPLIIGVVMLIAGDTSFVPWLLIGIGWFLSAVFALTQLLTHGRRGVTAGKAALRLRSISASDLGRPGFWRVTLRALVLWASALVFVVVGPAVLFASSLWDPQRRGRSILDRIGGCWVIDARAGLDPFDAKALRHERRVLRGRPDDTEHLPSMASGADAATALRIPDTRSRAGVVGPGGTGAQWSLARSTHDTSVIDGVPWADAAATAAAPAAPVAGFAAASELLSSTSPPRQTVPAPAATQPAPASPAPRPAAHPSPTPAQPAPAPAIPNPAPRPAAQPSPTPAQPAPTPAAAPGLRRTRAAARFDDGSVIAVPVLALIGRDPEPAPGESVEAVVRLDDPERLMSKTHAAFGRDAEGVWVSDRGSRNGTQLVSAAGDEVEVPAGESVRVPVGWTVRVGGRSFEVVPRGAES